MKPKQDPETIQHNGKELSLFIENNFDLYNKQMLPIIRSAVKNKIKGTFKQQRFDFQVKELVRSGKKEYASQFGTEFDMDARNVAVGILTEYLNEAIQWELDNGGEQ